MSYFEINDNEDFDLELIKFNDYYLKELTYYGSSKNEQLLMLMCIGQTISVMEDNIINNYYKHYVKAVLADINDPNIYCLKQIIYTFTNMIIKMVMLYETNKTNKTNKINGLNDETLTYKLMYLIGCVENYINKIIDPIESKLDEIFLSQNVFKLDYPIVYLENFVDANKNNFTSKEKFFKFKIIIKILEITNK